MCCDCDITFYDIGHLCDSDVTPFPYFTFIVFLKKLSIYYIEHISRLWQVQSTYLNKRDMKRERKRKQIQKRVEKGI